MAFLTMPQIYDAAWHQMQLSSIPLIAAMTLHTNKQMPDLCARRSNVWFILPVRERWEVHYCHHTFLPFFLDN